MGIIRIGDHIVGVERPIPLGRTFKIAEYLAQKVFNPAPDSNEIKKYYLQSQPLAEKPPFFNDLPDGTPDLGEYEVKILGKLLSPQRPVIVIVGPMGSGKTTLKDFVALGLLKNRKHCSNCNPPADRLISHIDFNEHIDLNDLEIKELNKRLYNLLCDELISRINVTDIINPEFEFNKFWKKEIDDYKNQKSSSSAFRKIISQDTDRIATNYEVKNTEIIEKKKKLLAKLQKSDECYLDYLIRLWKYIIQTKFNCVNGCGVILLDNLDRVNPNVQRKVIDIVHTHAKIGGPTFMILVRPETFDNIGLGTGIIDVEDQIGPKPIDLILKRLDEFCNNPEAYYDANAGLTMEQFELVTKHMKRVRRVIQNDPYQAFHKFIDNACGKSIRIGYLVAQNLFFASVAEMQNDKLSIHDIVRLCIRGDSPQLKWTPSNTIEHLFRISNRTYDGLLLKPRILKYIGRSNRDRRKLGEINYIMMGFGFDDTATINAINDLMQINHQLLRSNGFDFYDQKTELSSSGHNIRITEIGRGYSDYLLCDLDYIQEIMLDTFVDGDYFPKEIGFGYLYDKFYLVYNFIKELRRIDCKEVNLFIEKWGSDGYKEAFGTHLLSLDIIHGVYPSIQRVIRSVQSNDQLEELLQHFESLVLLVENDNYELLDVRVETILRS